MTGTMAVMALEDHDRKLHRGIRNGTVLAIFAWSCIFTGGWALYKQYADVQVLRVLHPDRMKVDEHRPTPATSVYRVDC